MFLRTNTHSKLLVCSHKIFRISETVHSKLGKGIMFVSRQINPSESQANPNQAKPNARVSYS